MPFLNAPQASVLIAIITIAYGIRWERHYVAWIAVVMNLVFTVVMLAIVDLPVNVVIVLVAYIIAGIVSA
jgi:hypothetical protein